MMRKRKTRKIEKREMEDRIKIKEGAVEFWVNRSGR
jgi:hypothetical protein